MMVIHPPGWPPTKGYSSGISCTGRMIFVSGQVGWDEQHVFHSTDLIGQIRQALKNIVTILAEAGASPDQIVRMTWYLTDRDEYNARRSEIGSVYRQIIGRHYPTMTVVQVSGFIEKDAVIEIEATAMLPFDEPAGQQ